MSLHRRKEFLGGDLLELRMRVEEGHVVIQFHGRVFLDFQYFQFEYNGLYIYIYLKNFIYIKINIYIFFFLFIDCIAAFPDRGCLLELPIAGDFSSGPCRHQGGW